MRARVVVTRDEPADGPLATALRRAGLEAVPVPVVTHAGPLDPEPLRRAASTLETYDWLIAASRRGVEALMDARPGTKLPRSLRTAATGTSTAQALAARGATGTLIAREAGADGLIAALAGESWSGKRVLLPRAEEGSRDIACALRAMGAEVSEVVAYRTVALEPDRIAAAWPARDPDALVIASPSAARALVDGVGVKRVARVRILVAIGPTTAESLARLGLAARVPSHASFEAVAALTAELLAADHGPEAVLPGSRAEEERA
jgi:uroporphyrinogen-III synthase